jgi:hypothetical protein
LNQNNVFVGILHAQRFEHVPSDDASVLTLCTIFSGSGHGYAPVGCCIGGLKVRCLVSLPMSPLWRPAPLKTVRFGPAPPSRDRVHDDSVRVGPWAVAIARPVIRGRADPRSGRRARSPDVRLSSSASNDGGSNRSSCYRAAVFAPMDSPANPSNARCRKGPSDLGLSGVQRE